MLDKQEKKLPEVTENQKTDPKESVEETLSENDSKEENGKPSEVEKPLKTDPAVEEVKLIEEKIENKEEVDEKIEEKKVEDEDKKIEDKKVEEKTSNLKLVKQDEKSQDAVDEVEKQVAKKSEDVLQVPEVPMEDYKALNLEGVVSYINKLIEDHPIQSIKKHVDVLKKIFNKQFGKLLKEAKTKFLEEGGNTIDFHYDNPIQEEYNKILFKYKKRLKKYYKELENTYEDNLLLKRRIIDELKELIDNGEANSMYKHFKEIQTKWREVGPVSRNDYSDLWRTYHFHVERFYDLLHLRNDLRDLDFKHNLDEKLKLIVKAEALAESDDIKYAFDELQVLHRLWKEEIGPVARENREEVWGRFSEATKKIHDKRHIFFDSLKEKFQENLEKKEAVIAEISALDTSENKTHYDWQKSIKEINALRKQFFDLGKVSRSKNKYIWNKFKEATREFNQKKNVFYKDIKSEQRDNLEKKLKLVEQAESLRDSEDWENVTDVMKRIQAEWKTIGHVPRKQSDIIWNRFKEACNHYFDRLHNKQDAVDEEKFAVYKAKKDYFENLKSQAEGEDFKPDINQLKKYISEWKKIGIVPKAQRYIEGKFNKFLDTYFDKLSLSKKESAIIRYRNIMDGFVEQKDYRKLESEVQFVRKKIDIISKEKQQLENNMLFFSNADDSNPMIKKILKTIDQHKEELGIWEAKLQYLRSIG